MKSLEIAVTSPADAHAAVQGGAHSIELSYDLARDGLTPELDLVQSVRDAVPVDLHIMVRPHDRNFVYTAPEVDLILQQAAQFANLGVTGIVFGARRADNTLDTALIEQVAAAAKGVKVTVHRALDRCADPVNALAELKGIVPRILTSGPANTAWEGRAGLRNWVEQFGNQYEWIAAGSITLDNIGSLARYTGVNGCHSSSAARTNGQIDPAKVRRLAEALAGYKTTEEN